MSSMKKNILFYVFILILVLDSFELNYACDTWVALKDATKNGYVILAKNSDRTLFDCQPLVFYPRQSWDADTGINLGRISIPQVQETYATIGSSPYWCWGYEEGINEFGVAIGNEGIWTKVLVEETSAYKNGNEPKLGPTGMDYVRLGLERGRTAREALTIITKLIEKYGQFGSGIPTQGVDGAYHNSFIIADTKEAWVLETAGIHWIAKKFDKGSTSISNKLSITTEWDISSSDLVDYAIVKGWWQKTDRKKFDFTKAYSNDALSSRMQDRRANTRAMCSQNLLKEKYGDIDARWMMHIARDRSSNPSIDLDQTASSCVALLPDSREQLPVFWWCPSVPSSSCYVPFFIHGKELPEIVSNAGTYGKKITPPEKVEPDQFAENSYWWIFRDLANLTNIDWIKRNAIVRTEFDHLEQEFEAGIPDVMKKAVALRNIGKTEDAAIVLSEYSKNCVAKVLDKANELRKQFKNQAAEVPAEFKPYLGKYTSSVGTFTNVEFTILMQNGKLAVDIPGQMIFELTAPDEKGMRYFVITNLVGVTFDKDKTGKITALKIHQTTPIQRTTDRPNSLFQNVPEKYLPYVGKYLLGPIRKEIFVKVADEKLAIDFVDQGMPKLTDPDENGRWYFEGDSAASVTFAKDDSGRITTMNLLQVISIPKGKCAACLVEKIIKESGVEEAIQKYKEIKADKAEEYVFHERGLNAVGYNLLRSDKIEEAIEIFKFNVEEYPDAFNVYDSLGEAYMKHGDKELAIQNYKKSLELNPKNENAKQKLEELEKGN